MSDNFLTPTKHQLKARLDYLNGNYGELTRCISYDEKEIKEHLKDTSKLGSKILEKEGDDCFYEVNNDFK